MRKFVKGTDEQYADLKRRLQDEQCHVYRKCQLPACCSRSTCSIAFEKDCNAYKLLIDKGITCSAMRGGTALIQFKQLLSAGEAIFIDFNDLKVFLKSLSVLY